MSKKSLLDRIEFPKPCFADWKRMVGTEQIRFCEECNKHVYNLSGMARGEAEALIASAAKGRLCARLTRNADGVTVTADDPPGVRLMWRHASPIANAVVSALLTMATPGVAGAAQITGQRPPVHLAVGETDAKPDFQGASGVFSGTLLDPQQAVIPGGKIDLINEETGEVQTTTSSENGTFRFTVASAGLYTLKASATGFGAVEIQRLTPGQSGQIDVKLAPVEYVTAGGIRIPVLTLRDLYNISDRVVVARAGRSLRVKRDGESNLIRTSLTVSSTLKGADEPALNVYHYAYGEEQSPFPGAESFLVFLRRSGIGDAQDIEGYELTDYQRGIKRLSSSELDVYVQRINELARMSAEKEPGPEEVVEWLVRCAEDPVTRWEGARDLALSAARLRASCTRNDSDGENDSSDDPDEEESDKSDEVAVAEQLTTAAQELADGATFAAVLTADQKERLMKALLSKDESNEGDRELIELVKDFHDPRLLPFLVSQLRRMDDNPPEIANTIVQVVAELLSDKRINALAESYADAPYDNEDEEDEKGDQGATTTQSVAARERSARMLLFLQQVDRIMRGRNLKPAKQ